MFPDVLQAVLGMFGSFGGNPIKLREVDPLTDRQEVENLRLGQLLALGLSFVIVASIAADQGSARPLAYWVLVVIALLLLYEGCLQDRRQQEG